MYNYQNLLSLVKKHRIISVVLLSIIAFLIVVLYLLNTRADIEYRVDKEFLPETVLYNLTIKTKPALKVLVDKKPYMSDDRGIITVPLDSKDLQDGTNNIVTRVEDSFWRTTTRVVDVNKKLEPIKVEENKLEKTEYDYFKNTLTLKGYLRVYPIHSKVTYFGQNLVESTLGMYPYSVMIENAVNDQYKVNSPVSKVALETVEGNKMTSDTGISAQLPGSISTDITINSPKNLVVSTKEIVIKGKTSPNTDVTINNENAEVDKSTGEFSKHVVLENPGRKTFTIDVKNPYLQTNRKEITLSRDPTVEEKEAQRKLEEEARRQKELADQKAYKDSARPINYNLVLKDPDAHKGNIVYLKGTIVDIFPKGTGESIKVMFSGNVVQVDYPDKTDFLNYENIEVWGEITGSYSYLSPAGIYWTIPSVKATMIQGY